ncbi:very short patch repair endonuclease [Desulforhopalus singaporensis]|uniref:very short patch repair endonuclease n=1 Tax=Desulforhopalus singaporensis TaxID=91360 RepID=UPI000B8614A5
MADHLSKDKRSWNMSRIRSKNTKPEMIVRSLLHRMGYRFRLHRRDLPGTPDIVLPKHKIVIFCHGCFWHQHLECKRAAKPKTNTDYWENKLLNNVKRFKINKRELETQGWRVIIIWECETKSIETLTQIIRERMK